MRLVSNPLTWGMMLLVKAKFSTSGDGHVVPLSLRLRKRYVLQYEERGALDARLEIIDSCQAIDRVYVMGCGRSGTWLLTALMSTFKGVCVVAKEVPVELFAQLTTTGRTLVLKRNNTAYRRFAEIPSRIKIVYAIRHPYDVLTSYNPTSGNTYHIDTERWLGELSALRAAIAEGRENLCIVRYEDLVSDPEDTQRKIGEEQSLKVQTTVHELDRVFNPSTRANSAMHGLRRLDKKSLYKFKNDPAKIAHLHSIKPKLGETLDWVGSRFDYDTKLPGAF
jgi:hypothetical protein